MTYLICVFLISGIMSGCKRIELYELTTKVKVNFAIDLDIKTDLNMEVSGPLDKGFADKVNGIMPGYMDVVFYDIHTKERKASFILPSSGGEVKVAPGDYHIVAYNFGTSSTQTDHVADMERMVAFTTDITKTMAGKFEKSAVNEDPNLQAVGGTESKGYDDDPIIYEPDHLYVANEYDINIPSVLSHKEEVVVWATASTILDVYSLEVIGVTGCENIEKVEAFITGQIKNNYFGQERRGKDPATLYVELKTDAKNNRLYTVFGTFGKLPGEQNHVYLDITVTNTDGGQYRYVYDVTDQFDDSGNIHNRLVIVDEIDIPEGSVGGGGLAPEIKDWEKESVDIPLC